MVRPCLMAQGTHPHARLCKHNPHTGREGMCVLGTRCAREWTHGGQPTLCRHRAPSSALSCIPNGNTNARNLQRQARTCWLALVGNLPHCTSPPPCIGSGPTPTNRCRLLPTVGHPETVVKDFLGSDPAPFRISIMRAKHAVGLHHAHTQRTHTPAVACVPRAR